MSNIILVTGGARSGKSTFAEKLAAKLDTSHKAYIATAQIFDEEMAHRVKLHQMRRADNWTTFESPFNAEIAINEAAKSHNVILFDCLTIYISNFICQFESLEDLEEINVQLRNAINKVISAAEKVSGTIIFVTNEVGFGIVPENKLARVFRDCQGIANQMIASAANEVYLVVSGLAVNLSDLKIN